MDLTKKDRVFLINQYRILAALNENEADHYNELIEILQSGYKIFYSEIDQWVFDDMPEDEGKFVLNILNFYRAIEDLKRSCKSEALSSHYHSIFRGFDGNNETEYMGFARFLINDQGKFAEQQQYLMKNDSLNSHDPMIEKYQRILRKWEELGKNWKLSEEQALEILNS
jgi:uncharacterized protein YfbU (UPF0304 family)